MTMEHQPLEDVFPIESIGIFHCHVSFRGWYIHPNVNEFSSFRSTFRSLCCQSILSHQGTATDKWHNRKTPFSTIDICFYK